MGGWKTRIGEIPGYYVTRGSRNAKIKNIRGIRKDSPFKYVPESVFEERVKAFNEPRTLTAILCGDPLPSRSALAKEQRIAAGLEVPLNDVQETSEVSELSDW